jgi:hypothetical protein
LLTGSDGNVPVGVLSFPIRFAKPEQAVFSPGHVVIVAWVLAREWEWR